jgi:hypothetical protein
VHLVRLLARAEPRAASVAAVRTRALGDWTEDQREDANRVALARLRGQYVVRVEGVLPAAGTP